MERNLAADVAAAWPGESLIRVRGMTFNTYSDDLFIDDVRFSNAMTVEPDTIGPDAIGHILRHTTIDATTYARTDCRLHYDQVGSVLSTSDATNVKEFAGYPEEVEKH